MVARGTSSTAACAALGVELHEFDWNDAARKAGVRDGALYLIRPDGYVGLADADADVSRLRAYLAALVVLPVQHVDGM